MRDSENNKTENLGDPLNNGGSSDEKNHQLTSVDINEKKYELKVYKTRWIVLGLFVFYSATSAYQWIEYSIISNIVSRYYGVSSVAVDWTSMCFMLYYIILVVPGSYLSEKIGLRRTTVLGCSLCCIGSWIKVFSVNPDRFWVTFIGQSLIASTQIFVATTPGRISAQWFDSTQLSTATSLGIVGCQVGIAIGFFITPIVVRNHVNLDDIGNDLSRLFWAVAIISTVATILVIILFRDEPPLPPSQARALQRDNRRDNNEGFVEPVKRLFKNKSYLFLCNSYGLNVGVLNAVSTLLNQIYLSHFKISIGIPFWTIWVITDSILDLILYYVLDYIFLFGRNGEKEAGELGVAIILTGMLGSVTFGYILDKTHKFKGTTVTVYFLTLVGQVMFALAMWCEAKRMVYFAATFLGIFMSGYLALGYEMCAEYTYPEAESIATGILNITNNIYGIILVLISGYLMESYGDFGIHVCLCVALLIGFILTLITKDETRRQDARNASSIYTSVNTNEGIPSPVIHSISH